MDFSIVLYEELSKLLGRSPLRLAIFTALLFLFLATTLAIDPSSSEQNLVLSRCSMIALTGLAAFMIPVFILRLLDLVEFRQEGRGGIYVPNAKEFIPDESPLTPTVQFTLLLILLLCAFAAQIWFGVALYRQVSSEIASGQSVAYGHYFLYNLLGAFLAWPSIKANALFVANALRLMSQEHYWMEEQAAAAQSIHEASVKDQRH